MPSVLELYEKLKPKLGEDEARSLLEYVEATVEQHAATKADVREAAGELREEIHQVEGKLREEIHQVEGKLREEIRQVEGKLREEMHLIDSGLRGEIHRVREEMHSMKAELIKWSFMFWAGAVAALSGMMFAMFRAFSSH